MAENLDGYSADESNQSNTIFIGACVYVCNCNNRQIGIGFDSYQRQLWKNQLVIFPHLFG